VLPIEAVIDPELIFCQQTGMPELVCDRLGLTIRFTPADAPELDTTTMGATSATAPAAARSRLDVRQVPDCVPPNAGRDRFLLLWPPRFKGFIIGPPLHALPARKGLLSGDQTAPGETRQMPHW
jgi:hypothetical protein